MANKSGLTANNGIIFANVRHVKSKVSVIEGFHYIDDQIMESVDVYGNYQEALPSDFSRE
ncbi:hypothetical protein [Bacillus sp. SD088]|uniref:hypothetical protein n=1 Tax=Bacillus sp. SD088 TaxID=2782012 RepID=UPI001A95BD60|nr:hypothetical protein [Bacillus sp. SD088]MBO0994869.1 hypothetical protein [Bacillus sp. SD088]